MLIVQVLFCIDGLAHELLSCVQLLLKPRFVFPGMVPGTTKKF